MHACKKFKTKHSKRRSLKNEVQQFLPFTFRVNGGVSLSNSDGLLDTKASSGGVGGYNFHDKVCLTLAAVLVDRGSGAIKMFLHSLVQRAFGAANIFRLTLSAYHAVDAVLFLTQMRIDRAIDQSAFLLNGFSIEEGAQIPVLAVHPYWKLG